MAYCRWSDESDAYVWGDDKNVHVWISETHFKGNERQAYEALIKLKETGLFNVKEETIERMKEIAEELNQFQCNKEYGIIKRDKV